MSDKILLLSGDGIGPSVLKSAEDVLKSVTDSVEPIHGLIGRSAYESTGHYIPHETLDLLDECKSIICGPCVSPENITPPVETLKVQLDLYSRVRYFKTLSPDLGVEGMQVTLWSSNNFVSNEITEVSELDGITLSKFVKNDSYNRMMTTARRDIESMGLKKIACLTREDFFPISSGMFSDAFNSVFTPDRFETRQLNVKDWMTHIIKNPLVDESIVCVDLYNQIVAGVLSGLTGYDYISPTAFFGDEYGLYEPSHTAVLTNVEEGYANPTSYILSIANIVRKFGLGSEADLIVDALSKTYRAGERTPDLNGTLSTEEFTQRVISNL